MSIVTMILDFIGKIFTVIIRVLTHPVGAALVVALCLTWVGYIKVSNLNHKIESLTEEIVMLNTTIDDHKEAINVYKLKVLTCNAVNESNAKSLLEFAKLGEKIQGNFDNLSVQIRDQQLVTRKKILAILATDKPKTCDESIRYLVTTAASLEFAK